MLHNFLTGFVVGVGSLLTTMAAAANPVPAKLAGTTWRWVHFTSSAEDFAVAEPGRYTLAFNMALTRAMCPRGSLGDRFARDVAQPSVGRSAKGSASPRTVGGRPHPAAHSTALTSYAAMSGNSQ